MFFVLGAGMYGVLSRDDFKNRFCVRQGSEFAKSLTIISIGVSTLFFYLSITGLLDKLHNGFKVGRIVHHYFYFSIAPAPQSFDISANPLRVNHFIERNIE